VTIDDGRYLIDPFFNRHYVHAESKEPLQFEALIEMIRKGESSQILPVYGEGLKMVEKKKCYSGEEFLEYIMGGYYRSGLKEALQERFGSTDELYLLLVDISKVQHTAIKQYDLKSLQPKSGGEVPGGWKRLWNGCICPVKARSVVHGSASQKVHATKTESIDESQFELCCYLSILEEIKKDEITFMELGAGWGAQSTNITGIVNNKMAKTQVIRACCVAVEAEPSHYQWLYDTFRENKIQGFPVFGAVSNEVGFKNFWSEVPPEDSYGQSLKESGSVSVPAYTVDYLLETHRLDHVDILHMDVQGEEAHVVRGMMESLKSSKIDYLVIATHYPGANIEISDMLNPYMRTVVSLRKSSGMHTVQGFKLPVNIPQDGFLLLKRKQLCQ
jgi:FkbM family methyltransferase